MDATVVPVEIHHPTDSNLLLDAVRELHRVLRHVETASGFTAYHRHLKRAKRRAMEILHLAPQAAARLLPRAAPVHRGDAGLRDLRAGPSRVRGRHARAGSSLPAPAWPARALVLALAVRRAAVVSRQALPPNSLLRCAAVNVTGARPAALAMNEVEVASAPPFDIASTTTGFSPPAHFAAAQAPPNQ